MSFEKKSIIKNTITFIILIGLLVLASIAFKYISVSKSSNTISSNNCDDCKRWTEEHKNRDFCTTMVWNCPICNKERLCG